MGTMIGRRKKKEGGKAPLLMIVSIVVRWVSVPFGREVITFLNRIIEGAETKVSVSLVLVVWAFPIVERTMKMLLWHCYSSSLVKRSVDHNLVVFVIDTRNVEEISACHIIGKVDTTVNTCKGSVLSVLSPLSHMTFDCIEKKL